MAENLLKIRDKLCKLLKIKDINVKVIFQKSWENFEVINVTINAFIRIFDVSFTFSFVISTNLYFLVLIPFFLNCFSVMNPVNFWGLMTPKPRRSYAYVYRYMDCTVFTLYSAIIGCLLVNSNSFFPPSLYYISIIITFHRFRICWSLDWFKQLSFNDRNLLKTSIRSYSCTYWLEQHK